MTYHAGGSTGTTGTALTALTDAGTLTTTDLDVVNRAGTDFQTSMLKRIQLMRATPVASKTTTVPYQLVAADNDSTIVFTGTGNLTAAAGLPDGFKCHIINNGSGTVTYSGITGLASQTTLTAAHCTTIVKVGSTVYALSY